MKTKKNKGISDQEGRSRVQRVRQRCLWNDVPFYEVSLKALLLYREEREQFLASGPTDYSPNKFARLRETYVDTRIPGLYSFMNLMALQTRRWDLVIFLERAADLLFAENRMRRVV